MQYTKGTNGVLQYAHVAGLLPATPQRIEDLMVTMRSNLLRIITHWEQSDQDQGGRDAHQERDSDDGASSNLTRPSQEQQADDDNNENSSTTRDNIGGLSQRPFRALQSRASFLNGRPSYLLYFWEGVDAHQILKSSLQRVKNNAGAADASKSPASSSTTRSNSSGGRWRALQRQQQQELDTGSSLIPLVESFNELAECQRQMVFHRVEDRNQERQLEEQRQQSEGAESSREIAFRRRAELVDLARKYRKLNAEFNPNDKDTRRLSEFYNEEGSLVEDEIILQLDPSSA